MAVAGKHNAKELRRRFGEWQWASYLYCTLQSKEEASGGSMKPIGERLGRWEKAKGGGEPLGLDKK